MPPPAGTLTANESGYSEEIVYPTPNTPKTGASISLLNLAQTYDGGAKTVAASTQPAGLPVVLTYNGGSQAPSSAGTYSVQASITDPNYNGSASGVLTISPASGAISLNNLAQSYDGTPKIVSASTQPAGLTVSITYNASTPGSDGRRSLHGGRHP